MTRTQAFAAVVVLLADQAPTLTLADREHVTRGVLALLRDNGWHGSTECHDFCPHAHCPDEGAHYGHDGLVESVQMLHGQAHNGPTEPLDARRCTREPCVTVGGGLGVSADVRGLFAPGSRIA